MLFSAGMGIGLVFYGAAEPLSHFANKTPHAAPGSQQAMADSFQFTFFHWGIHAWAVYGIVALALAYFGFRKEEKYLLSVTLKPLFGKNRWLAGIYYRYCYCGGNRYWCGNHAWFRCYSD